MHSKVNELINEEGIIISIINFSYFLCLEFKKKIEEIHKKMEIIHIDYDHLPEKKEIKESPTIKVFFFLFYKNDFFFKRQQIFQNKKIFLLNKKLFFL